MALISQSDLEARIGRTLTTDEQSAFTLINDAIQANVEKELNVSVEFVSATTRYYDGGRQHTPIDLCTDVSSVKLVDENESDIETISSDDYTIEPRNRTLKHQIRTRYGKIYSGFNNVAVTAKFSIFADTDALNIVKNAILDMLEQAIENKDNVVRESIEGYTIEFGKMSETASMKALRTLNPPVV